MKEDATFYFIVWTIVLLLAFTERIRKKPFNNVLISIIFMVAAIVVACRVEVGADWDHYRFIFYNGYDENRDTVSLEPLFMFFRSFFFYLGFTHAGFFLVLSLISLFAIRKAAELFGVKYFMTVFLVYYSMFFLNYQFNIVRHGVMASFVWLCFAYKSKGKIIFAIISIIVALGFHYTALIFVPFLFFIDRKFSKPVVFIILAISYLTYFMQLSQRIIAFFPFLYEMERTASFVTSGQFVEDVGLSLGSQIQVLLSLLLYIRFGNVYKQEQSFRMLVNTLLFSFLLLCILNAFSAVVSRICNVLFMALIFLLPLFVEKIKVSTNRIITETLIVLYMIMAFPKTFSIQKDGYSEMLPYKFEIEQLTNKNAK